MRETTGRTNGKGQRIKELHISRVPRIIAFSGKYGSGKDTLADAIRDFLADKIGKHNIVDLKFAGALKEAGAIILGVPVEEMYSDEGKAKLISKIGMTNGRFQQLFGMAARQVHPDIWIVNVLNTCDESTNQICLITDCRFKNEANGVQDLGGVVIRLNRSDNLISEKSKAGRDPTHISETDLDDYPNFDLVYQNDGTIQEMISTVFKFLNFDLPDTIVHKPANK